MYTGGPTIYNDYAYMHHQELLQAAETQRLLRQAIYHENACIQRYRLYQRALLKLGEQLVSWGTNLQRRYTRENEAPALATCRERGV